MSYGKAKEKHKPLKEQTKVISLMQLKGMALLATLLI